jgi:hypothetical protein
MSSTRKSLLAVGLVVAGALSGFVGQALAGVQTFNDVSPDHPFFDDIEFVADRGIANGYPDGSFRPGQNVTRQAMAAFIHRAQEVQMVSNVNEVDNSSSTSFAVGCPAGMQVMAGGGQVNVANVYLTDSYPNGSGNSWTVGYETENNANLDFTATAWAMCGRVDTTLD